MSQEVLNFLLDHAAADPVGSGRRAEGVADVVVTAQVKRWHALHTLAVIYNTEKWKRDNPKTYAAVARAFARSRRTCHTK